MLKLNPDPQFVADVELTVPGKQETATVTFTFRYKGKKELDTFWAERADQEDADTLAEIITDWSGVDVPYSQENLRLLLDNYPAASSEIVGVYIRELFESKVKNSKLPPLR